MPNRDQFKEATIADSETVLVTATSSPLLLRRIGINITAGDVTIHIGTPISATNVISKSNSPGREVFPLKWIDKGQDIRMTGANTPAGSVVIQYSLER